MCRAEAGARGGTHARSYESAPRGTTSTGSPRKAAKRAQVDERFQMLLQRAQRDWDRVVPQIDSLTAQLTSFLHEPPAAPVQNVAAEELPSVDDFVYHEPEPMAVPQADDEADREMKLIMGVLYSFYPAAMAEFSSGEEPVDVSTLMAQVNQRMADLAEDEGQDEDRAHASSSSSSSQVTSSSGSGSRRCSTSHTVASATN